MQIREMNDMDIAKVCLLEEQIFSEPWSPEDFNKAMINKDNTYLVAENEEDIVGYCGYWGIAGEAYIYNVAVAQEYRRQKIAYSLLKELIRIGQEKGTRSFTLEVRRSNNAAIFLYESLGFTKTGIRKDFYTKPKEDAVIMWLELIQ